MENLIVCSLVESGVKCGEVAFISQVQYQLVIMGAIIFSLVIALFLAAIVIEYENKQFKKKMRDLGYGHILGELSGASEKWIPQKKQEWYGDRTIPIIKRKREAP